VLSSSASPGFALVAQDATAGIGSVKTAQCNTALRLPRGRRRL
jgi:hypothetical protein